MSIPPPDEPPSAPPPPPGPPSPAGWGPPPGPGGTGNNTALIVVAVLVVVGLAIVGIVLLNGDDDEDETGGTIPPPPSGGLPDPDDLDVDVPNDGGVGEDGGGEGAQSGDVIAFCTEGFAIGELWGFSRPERFAYHEDATSYVSPEDAPEYIAELGALQPPDEIAEDFAVVVDHMSYSFADPETRGSVEPSVYESVQRVNDYAFEICRPLMDDDG